MAHRPRIRPAVVCATVFSATTCGLLGPVSIAQTAHGQVVQFSTSTVSSPRQGNIDRRDLDLMDKTVDLDDAQREIIEALHAGYSDQYNEESSAHRQYVQSLYQNTGQNADWQAIMTKVRAAQDQWQTNRERLNSEFLSSVRDILSEDQLARWPIVQRDRRRRTMLPAAARFSGENVDLIDLVEDLDLPADQRTALDPTLNAWADELDALLQARKTANDQWEKNVQQPLASGNPPDPQRIQEWRDRLMQRRRALRDLNLRYAQIIPTQLSVPLNTEFTSAFNLAAYRGIYRPTAADRYIETALSLANMTSEQGDAIKMIERDYDGQVLLINDQLAGIRRADEDSGELHPFLGAPDFDRGPHIAMSLPGHSGVVDGDSGGTWVMSQHIEIMTEDDMGNTSHVIQDGHLPFDEGQIENSLILAPVIESEDPDSPKARLSRSKQQLVQRTIKSVHAILTPDQQAQAPMPDQRQMLSPEERMRQRMEKALSNMIIDDDGQGNIRVELQVRDDEPEN